MARLPEGTWQRLSASEGSQGAYWYEWACLPLSYVSGPSMAHGVLARRSVSDPHEVA